MKMNSAISKPLALLAIAIFTAGCSSDDDSTAVSSVDYFPLQEGNTWTYENTFSDSNQAQSTDIEKLTVSGQTQENNQTVYQLESTGNAIPLTLTSMLAVGNVRKSNGKLLYNGSLSLDLNSIADLPAEIDPISIDISDAVLYDTGASADETLYSVSDAVSQTVTIGGNEVPLSLNYSFKSVQGDFLMNSSVDGTSYDDIVTSNLYLEVEGTIDLFVSVPIIDNQELMHTKNYFAADTGLIKSRNELSLNINAIEELQTPAINYEAESTQNLQSFELP